ncbi:MAG TPA: 2-oxoglutarate dehydrogenase complex dihydrolipoyllysine-residue succinyltransferase [Armatimonadota bacterium]|jgi:2-oxoglutarate dehydrogenase E2 component (dihydrolipoamide succinyltransferase)
MPVELRVPPLGESVVEATLGRWMRQVGDRVSAGDVVAELETDKINVEVHAEADGVIAQIAHQEGETVGVGDVLGIVDEAADGKGAPAAPPAQARAEAPSALPPGYAAAEASVGGQTPAPPELQEAPKAVPQPATPMAPPPAPLPEGPKEPRLGGIAETEPPSDLSEEHLISPMARRLAEEMSVNLSQVRGTGPGGRVTKEDVEGFAGTQPSPTRAPVESPGLASQPPPELQETRPEERVRMSRRRQTIAVRLVEAQHSAAMLTTFNEVDMSAVMELRARHKERFKERHGVGLGFMSFFTRAAIGALREFPRLNAEIQGTEMVLKHYYDIGIAVSTEEGLVVPVLRDADRLSFAEVERRIAELASRAREGKLTLQELRGGTFTLTNGGVFGSLLSTPILNTPQVGILGMHEIEERPIALKGQVVIRPMMYLALSYDHRIVDGSEAVRFLVRLKDLIEDPSALLLED